MSTSPFVTLKKVWVSSALGLLLLGSLTACAEKPAPIKAADNSSGAVKPADNHPDDGPANTNLTDKDFDPSGIASLTEGKDYKKIAEPQPVQIAGKPEVIEFFWYGCPHCNRIEPAVQAWKKTIPADVNFIRAHAFWGKPMDEHQKIFYTLGVLKKNDAMDDKVFSAIHNDGMGLAKPELISEFMVKNGIEKAAWDSAYNSFAVNTEVAKANSLFKAYGLTGVPNFIVNGKYAVGGETARTLQVVNKLIEIERGKK